MARYVLETDRKIACCFDCPMLFDDMCLATGRENYDERDIRPIWCPLVPCEVIALDEICQLAREFESSPGGCSFFVVDGGDDNA